MTDLFEYERPTRYPDAPGYKDRDTSRKAAASMRDAAPLLRGKCLDAIRQAPAGLTADEVADRVAESVLSVRPRITELLHDGKVKDAGTRRRNASGRSAKVWSLA